MRRLICLFLILWLPLFMGSAWAMNMQMQFENQQVQTLQSSHMGCHKNVDKKQSNSAHKCVMCGMCALANAVANFNTAPVLNMAVNQSPAPQFFYVAFTSQDYPPSYKPPIFI